MSARDWDLFLRMVLVVSEPLTSEERDWGPAMSVTSTLLARCLSLFLVSVPCSSGNTASLDLTKLWGKPDLEITELQSGLDLTAV